MNSNEVPMFVHCCNACGSRGGSIQFSSCECRSKAGSKGYRVTALVDYGTHSEYELDIPAATQQKWHEFRVRQNALKNITNLHGRRERKISEARKELSYMVNITRGSNWNFLDFIQELIFIMLMPLGLLVLSVYCWNLCSDRDTFALLYAAAYAIILVILISRTFFLRNQGLRELNIALLEQDKWRSLGALHRLTSKFVRARWSMNAFMPTGVMAVALAFISTAIASQTQFVGPNAKTISLILVGIATVGVFFISFLTRISICSEWLNEKYDEV